MPFKDQGESLFGLFFRGRGKGILPSYRIDGSLYSDQRVMYMAKNTRIGSRLVRSTSLVLAVVMACGIVWNIYSQKKQAQLELLENSRILAQQVLALRKVTAENQPRINYDSRGNLEFKHLNPAAVVRQVGGVFNENTRYRIRQVSLKPRVSENRPDEYEREVLLAFREAGTGGPGEHWGTDAIDGERYFRYMIPLYITPPCLPCHGEPEGETDISGYPREGYRTGELAGALSIAVPMKLKEASLNRSITQSILLTVVAISVSAAVIIFHTHRFVTRPIDSLNRFSSELGRGNLAALPEDLQTYGEIRELTEKFVDMAERLKEMYDSLEQKVAERTSELADANLRLSEVSRYKSEFLANMSHELRTPLTAVLAFTEELLCLETGSLNSRQKEYLAEIRDSGRQLLELINDLLDLAKTESGKMTLKLTEVRVGETAGDVTRLLQPLADSKNIKIITDISDSGAIIADAEKVRHVVQNLLGNAIKFTTPGGSIRIGVADTLVPDEGIILTVRDSGPGIADADREKIFDAFYQVNSGPAREFGGTGLGLALVKKIVELHLGRIEVVSVIGQGAEFKVFLPAYPMFDDGVE